MDIHEAIRNIESKYKEWFVKYAFDLPDKYVFTLYQKSSNEPSIDSMHAIDKKTGKISGYAFQLDKENWDKRKMVEIQNEGGTNMTHSDVNDVLQHHGIKGQKWGDRNGPPYPLDSAEGLPKKEAAVVRKRLKKEDSAEGRKKKAARQKIIENYRKKKAAKWKEKIAQDPEKMLKNADKFTTKEIDAAIAKINDKRRLSEAIESAPVESLSAYKKFLTRNADALYRNRSKLTDAEMDYALKKINKELQAEEAKNKKFNLKQEKAAASLKTVNASMETMSKAAGTVSNVASAVSNIRGAQIRGIDLKRQKDRLSVEKAQGQLEKMNIADQIKNFEANKAREKDLANAAYAKAVLDNKYRRAQAASLNAKTKEQSLKNISSELEVSEKRQKLDKAVRTKIISGTYKPINPKKVDSFIKDNKKSLDIPASSLTYEDYDLYNQWLNIRNK